MAITKLPQVGSGASIFDNNYLDEMRDQLLGKIVLEGDTLEFATVIPGVKNRMSLNGLDEVGPVTDASCGWPSEPGEITLSQNELIVYPKQIKDHICPKEMEKMYLGMYMKNNKEVPFVGVIAEQYAKKGHKFVEEFIWKGDYNFATHTAGSQNGIYGIVGASTSVVDASTAVDAETTIIKKVNAMVAAMPETIAHRDDLVLCMPWTDFMTYQRALVDANLYHYDANVGSKYEIFVPGTTIKIKAVAGMTGATKKTGGKGEMWILTYAANIVCGTDMLDNDESFDMWYSKDNDEVRVNVQFKIGATVRYDEFTVRGYNSASL